MNDLEFESAPPVNERPKTATVVGLLIAAAMIISYLSSYAVANAMVAADVVKPWPADSDPRPKWFIIGFIILITLFGGIAMAARQLSALQMKKFDEMEKE